MQQADYFPVGGWGRPHESPLWHYFDDDAPPTEGAARWVGFGSALCGAGFAGLDRTGYLDDYIGEPQPDDCPGCRRRVDERRAVETMRNMRQLMPCLACEVRMAVPGTALCTTCDAVGAPDAREETDATTSREQ